MIFVFFFTLFSHEKRNFLNSAFLLGHGNNISIPNFFRVTEDLQEKKKQLQIALEEKQKQEDQLKLCKQQGEEFIRR